MRLTVLGSLTVKRAASPLTISHFAVMLKLVNGWISKMASDYILKDAAEGIHLSLLAIEASVMNLALLAPIENSYDVSESFRDALSRGGANLRNTIKGHLLQALIFPNR